MRKVVLALIALFVAVSNGFSQAIPKADTKWFEDSRFGMFVHFEPYGVLGAGERVMNTRPIKGKDYMRLQNFFNPQSLDAGRWDQTADENRADQSARMDWPYPEMGEWLDPVDSIIEIVVK